ncbi:hypothetical protein pipiens_015559, partial [Culex pipiens pipiens]
PGTSLAAADPKGAFSLERRRVHTVRARRSVLEPQSVEGEEEALSLSRGLRFYIEWISSGERVTEKKSDKMSKFYAIFMLIILIAVEPGHCVKCYNCDSTSNEECTEIKKNSGIVPE